MARNTDHRGASWLIGAPLFFEIAQNGKTRRPNVQNNPYLYDENYEELQKKIKNVKVKHHVGDIRQISCMLNEEYDLVNLSNIINYIDFNEYKNILNNLSLSNDGIALSYIPVLEKYIKSSFNQDEYQFNNLDEEFPEAVMIYQKKK